jgi:ATP/maltotriose-dependent transcriptional regulator MalT
MELGWLCQRQSNFDEAERCFRESLDTYLRLGDGWASAWDTNGLSCLYKVTQRYPEALEMIQQHEDACAAVDDWGGVVYALSIKAELATKLHDTYAARTYLIQAIKRHLESGSQFAHLSYMLQAMYYMHMSEDNLESAVEILSFMHHYAEKAHASDVISIAEQLLTTVAQKLSPDTYRLALECGKKLHFRTILERLEADLTEDTPSSQNTSPIDALSERELEVLRLTAAGHSNRQIAHDLVLTLNTVKSHIHHIYGKLGVASRTQAVARARELHLL